MGDIEIRASILALILGTARGVLPPLLCTQSKLGGVDKLLMGRRFLIGRDPVKASADKVRLTRLQRSPLFNNWLKVSIRAGWIVW